MAAAERKDVVAEHQLVPPEEAGDLSTCDREPIHIPGSIQPHGVLLSLDESSLAVLQASENVAKHRRPGNLVRTRQTHRVRGELMNSDRAAGGPCLRERDVNRRENGTKDRQNGQNTE